jgi:AcrR family transcriptional regulator
MAKRIPKNFATATKGAAAGVPSNDESTRRRILNAAFAAFLERGYANTSTLEIATRAKVSKRDLYSHFDNKQAMLVACIAYGVQLMQPPSALPMAVDRPTLAAQLTAFGVNFLHVILGARVLSLYRLAVCEAGRSPEVARALDTTGRGGARKTLGALLAKAQATGLVIDGDVAAMAGRFLSLLLGEVHLRLLLGVIAPPSEEDIEARVRSTTEAFLILYQPRKAGGNSSFGG